MDLGLLLSFNNKQPPRQSSEYDPLALSSVNEKPTIENILMDFNMKARKDLGFKTDLKQIEQDF